jgi:hypothetical protein
VGGKDIRGDKRKEEKYVMQSETIEIIHIA